MAKHGLIVVAAGAGVRMQQPTPKILLPLNGVPLIVHTIRAFASLPIFSECVLVLAPDVLSQVSGPFWQKWELPFHWRCVPGGSRRQESMGLGLAALNPHCDYVWVHDGARPFVSHDLLQHLQETVEAGHNCIAAIPVSDTVKKVDGKKIVGTFDRRELYLAQTPQVFLASVLRAALERSRKEGWTVTDEASMVEKIGVKVHVVLGETTNIKITTPNDLVLGDFLAKQIRGLT